MQARLRIGSVSFLNAKPLIHGLESFDDLELHLAVPSRLLDGLTTSDPRQRLDVALLPVIDFQRVPELCLVPSGGIGCDGHTLTVRIFSLKPIDQIQSIACDTDSHTSVALARVILAERYGLHPRFADLTQEGRGAGDEGPTTDPKTDARLLIGDKVVCEEPAGFPHQLDLGFAWKELTGLPFVFAVWTARRGVDLRDLPQRLVAARQAGLAAVPDLVSRFGTPRGWPKELALQYLQNYLRFEIGPRQLQAIEHFHMLAARHGIIPSPARPLVLYPQ